MREVDEALSHAYARRGMAASASNVPPTPHWTRRNPDLPPFSRHGEDDATPTLVEDGEVATGRPVVRNRGIGGLAESPAFVSATIEPRPVRELQWPDIVLLLEREWGDRFEQMADRLIEVRDRQHHKVLLFTSCHRAEGRSTLVLTLARALARRPGRTVLVDADLTGPMLSRLLGMRIDIGLEEVVEEGHALADALIEAPDDHLWMLPLRAAVARPREFLAGPGWACTMARLRRDFDLVLVDGSPMFTGLSAAVLHRSVDAAVLVHHRGMTGERSLLRAREVLDAGGIPLLGLAETFV
jgi:protein-tyrosine kinase